MAEILYDAPVAPDELTYAIRNISPAPDLVLSNTAPITTSNSNTVRWGEITRRNRLAKYRSFDGQIAVSQRDGASDRMVRLAPFSNSLNLGEYERLQQEFLRLGGSQTAALVSAIYDDAALLTRSMHCRVEKALGQTLSTGKFTVSENNFASEADFGVASANKLTASVVWSTSATALAGNDLRTMRAKFVASAGVGPGRIVTSEAVVNALMVNAQIVGEALGTTSGRTWINREELAAWLRANRLPDVITEVETTVYNDETGADERVFPAHLIVMTPANLGSVLEFRYGLSATALELVQSNRAEISFADAPGIVGMVVKEGPPFRQFTYVDAVGMPILSGPKQVVIGSVLTP